MSVAQDQVRIASWRVDMYEVQQERAELHSKQKPAVNSRR